MDDLISRQAAYDCVLASDYSDIPNGGPLASQILDKMEKLPSIQPERKTGRWEITDAYPHNVYCSNCHKKFAQTHWAVWKDGSLPRNYCPNCGAKMEKGDNT